ncbi:MAG: hypothetical protein RIQ53_2682 [Pseudomonadota bacterium]|jgi:hypothetical protein
MNDELNVIVRTREEAHQAISHGYALARSIIENGNTARIHVLEDEDELTIRQRGFLHAAVFPQIAEQVTFPDGSRYVADAWKEYFRKRFLPDKFVMEKTLRWDAKLGRTVVAKRRTPQRKRISTEDLGVKRYSKHIDDVIDTAVLEFGVVFVFRANEREAVRYVGKATRKPKQRQAEAEPA